MSPLQPMLAGSANSVEEVLERHGEVGLEYKLDGARVQVHRLDDEVRVFTRKLNDVTHAVPEVVEAVRALPVRQIVLDGEAIVLREWRSSRTIPGHHAPLRTTPRRRRPTR